MFLKSENHYESLAQTDVMAISKPGGSSHTRRHIAKVVGLMALVACLPISFVMGLQQGRTNRHSIVLEWSDDLASLPTQPRKFQGSFRLENEYRGLPSPELDRAWDRYTAHPLIDGTASLISVERKDIERSNKTSAEDWVNATVQYGEVNGGGSMGTLELFHQLHCLNMLRKFVHIDYYKNLDPLFDGSRAKILMPHLDHCVEILRQVLSCNGDTGLIVFKWVKGNPVPYPDFNTWHQCRDPEQILHWAHAREAPIRVRVEKKLFSDLVEMPVAP